MTATSGARAWVASSTASAAPPSSSQRSRKPRRYSSVAAKIAVVQNPARKGAECSPWKRQLMSKAGWKPMGAAMNSPTAALISGTKITALHSTDQKLRGAAAKASTKGAVEPTKLRAISPKVETRPMGSTAMLTVATTANARNGQLIAGAIPWRRQSIAAMPKGMILTTAAPSVPTPPPAPLAARMSSWRSSARP